MSNGKRLCGKNKNFQIKVSFLEKDLQIFIISKKNSLEYEGINQSTNQKDLSTYAMDRYAYYVCYKCNKAYYGGEARCDAEMGDKYNPQELVCGGCSDIARAKVHLK